MPTITDQYDSNNDLTTFQLPPMVDPAILAHPPLCEDVSLAGRRHPVEGSPFFRLINPGDAAGAMGFPPSIVVCEPLGDLRPAVTPAEIREFCCRAAR